MKKKSSVTIAVIVVILAIILAITLFSASKSNVIPHMATRGSLKSAPFEGFHGLNPYRYASYPNNTTIDTKDRFLINDTSAQPTVQRIWGFDGLFGPVDIPDDKLDLYSEATGSLDQNCQSTASGLTNSKGFLCLNKKQVNMLKTRGGNQSSCPSTIGCSPL